LNTYAGSRVSLLNSSISLHSPPFIFLSSMMPSLQGE
jgi:hypothetical protein